MRRLLIYLVVLAVALGAWWALTASGAVAPLILPPLGTVAAALRVTLADPGTWAAAMGVTLATTAAGFVLAGLVAIPLGILLGGRRLLDRAYEPLLATLSAVPLVILYPVLAATLGIGTSSKVVLGGLYAFFPMAIATVRAVRQIDATLVTALRAMGARPARVVGTALIPAALPGIVSGMRVGLGLALVTVIAGEFIAGSDGVGYQLAASSQGYHSDQLFAWVVLTVLLTVFVNAVFATGTSLLEREIRR